MTDSRAGDPIDEATRAAARANLQRQWELGALDASEHERRATAVRHAQTRAELDRALQGTKPGMGMTGPVLPPFEGRPPTTPTPPGGSMRTGSMPAGSTPAPRDPGERTKGILKLDRNTAGTIVALTPIFCLFAVFALGAPWWIFFLWFAMPILVYGKDGRDEHRAEQHERRARRHAAKAARHRRRLEGR